MIALSIMVFGLIAGDVTARSGGIGIAVGLHFANNAFALCLFGVDGYLSGLSLFVLPEMTRQAAEISPLSVVDFVGISFAYIVFLIIVAVVTRTRTPGAKSPGRDKIANVNRAN